MAWVLGEGAVSDWAKQAGDARPGDQCEGRVSQVVRPEEGPKTAEGLCNSCGQHAMYTDGPG